ncbi:hypothetical protein GCM10018965_003040 [Nonomuraea roseola]
MFGIGAGLLDPLGLFLKAEASGQSGPLPGQERAAVGVTLFGEESRSQVLEREVAALR